MRTEVIEVRIGEVHRLALGADFPQLNDLVWLGIRQRPQEHAIDSTENGRSRTDPERERQYCHGCEAGIVRQYPQTVT